MGFMMLGTNSSLYMALAYLKDIQIVMVGNTDLILNKFYSTQFAEYLLGRMAPFRTL